MYDSALVTLSILIATLASYTAIDLSGRVRAYGGAVGAAWLAAAAIAMGGGIWAMHFVAMLAYSQPGLEVAYDPSLTTASFVIAVIVTGAAFGVSSRAGAGIGAIAVAGTAMGLGIVAMHYSGMWAIRTHARMAHDPAWVGVSVLVAVLASTAALLLTRSDERGALRRCAAAVAMGLAVSGMHYAGMSGVRFELEAITPIMEEASGANRAALVFAVSGTTFVILFLALVAATFDRRLAAASRREAAALRLSEELARDLYRQTPLPLHALDAGGTVEHVSDEWLDLLGYDRAEVIGRPLATFMEAPAASGPLPPIEDERQAERRFLTRDGRALDVLLSTRIERDAGGRFLRALGGLVDVTARKKAEAALRQSQKIEAIGQLTGGVAHDFNNLLAVVLGNLELLGRRLPDDPRLHRLLDGAEQGARRGAALTQRLLAFSRRQDLRPGPVALASLLDGIADLLARAAGPTVETERDVPPGLPPAHVDANQLELALVNLVVNARDAMPGGGRITISAAACADPDGLAPGTYLRIQVRDTGCGMDGDTLARACEPFFTTKGVGKGTGLGLSMVQGLAEQSDGHLAIESEPGRGTGVSLVLPAAAIGAETAAEAPPTPEEPGRAEGHRLLVVDDDPLVLMSTSEMLRDLGYEVGECTCGDDALAALAAPDPFDLLVTDYAMPGMTGAQLADRTAALRPELPVLLVTGYADAAKGGERRLPTLAKPFTQDALARAVAARLPERPPAVAAE